MSPQHRLEVIGLSKTFGPQRALVEASLTIAPGEIHGLIGENGSGKSTIVKLLSGYHKPDRGGVVRVDGETLDLPVNAADLQRRDISVVHQDLGLVDGFSVVENLRVGRFAVRRLTRSIRWREELAHARRVLDLLGLDIDPAMQVSSLSAAQRAGVAIARALQHHEPGRGLVMFDESSGALPRDALGVFHELVRGIAARGGSVLLVSHQLDEILALADRVTVLRDGCVVGEGLARRDLDERQLIRLMIGQDLHLVRDRRDRYERPTELAAAARAVTGAVIEDFDLDVRRGEIVGITGLVGSGYEEIPYLLAGARRALRGTLSLPPAELDLRRSSPGDHARCGVALVPERRGEEGLALGLSVLENITVPRVAQHGSAFRVGQGWQREEADWVIRTLGVRPPEADRAVGTLSGGNQQKVLLGKWLLGQPRLLILHEPTQGVDVGARTDILTVILQTAHDGAAVLIAGLDAGELSEVCDRVLVIRAGRVAAELADRLSFEAIVSAVYGQSEPTAHA